MGTITLPNVRATSDITVMVRLKYSGVAIDWTGLRDIKALIYSDEQKAIAGRCDIEISDVDNTILVCNYAATKPQYLGVNRVIIQAKYHGRTNTYDKPAFNIVARNSEVAEREAVVIDTSAEESVEVDVFIEVTAVSTSLLDNAIAAAIRAAADAEEAAHLVPLQVLTDCREATEDAQEATAGAQQAKADADAAAENANTKAGLANEKAGDAAAAASLAAEKAALADEKAQLADAKAGDANAAAARAEAAAEHDVPYIGENGHWWRWDKDAGEYVDTGEVAQGPQGLQGPNGEPAIAVENYETYTATAQTTAISDLLPASGEANTLYRIGSWDGTQYNAAKYCVYGWYDGAYKLLEVHNVGIDTEPTADSHNLVESGGVAAQIKQLGKEVTDLTRGNSDADFSISDQNAKAIVLFKNGHINTKNFDSSKTPKSEDMNVGDFCIMDENDNAIAVFKNGHIQTKNFDSSELNEVVHRYKDKKISILGDSISTYGVPSATNEQGTYCYSYYPSDSCRYSEDGVDSIRFSVFDTYWMKLIQKTGMILGINDSFRGSHVSGTSSVTPPFNSQTRINHLGENGTPDVILVYGGTNDAGNGVTVGTFNTENPQNYTDEEIANLPVATFADAYRTMLIRLMKTYPSAEIVVVLPTFTTSYYTITNLDLYVELIKEACDFFGIKYIDARCSGINVFNRASYLSDGIHPNARGMQLLYEKIYRCLIFE